MHLVFQRALSACLMGVLGACATSPRSVDEARLPEDFGFRWRVPSRIEVSEITTTPSTTIVLAYQAELVREDDHLRLRHLDAEVRRAGDLVVGYDDRQSALVATAHRLVDLTDALIAPDGRVLGCVPSPALQMRASGHVQGLPKEQRAAYEIQIRDAATAALLASTCIERWQSWVSAWVGFEALPGMPDHWHADLDVPIGEEPKINVIDEHQGDLPQGGVRVTRRQEIDGAALTDELAPLASALTAERKTPIVADRLSIASATYTAQADLDPKTLRPSRIEWRKVLRFALDGMSEERVTHREWTFKFR